MRDYEEIIIEETKLLPKEVICNKCGKSMELNGEDYEREFQSNLFQQIVIHFGYGSKFDMDCWEFDLCEECLVEFIRTFKHSPEGTDESYVNKKYPKLNTLTPEQSKSSAEFRKKARERD